MRDDSDRADQVVGLGRLIELGKQGTPAAARRATVRVDLDAA